MRLGSRFDAASFEEIEACLAAGAAPRRSATATPSRRCRPSGARFAAGVDAVRLRLAPRNWRSWPATRRAAASIAASWWRTRAPTGRCRASSAPPSKRARELMLRAGEMGLDPYGLSFHVGSQQTTTASYEAAIGQVAMLFTDLARRRGQPAHAQPGRRLPGAATATTVPGIDAFGQRHHARHDRAFRQCAAGDGDRARPLRRRPTPGVVAAEVVLVSRRDPADPVRWVYLDIGRFGGLAETEGEVDPLPHHHPARRRRDWAGGDRRADLRRRGHPVRAHQLPPAHGADLRATASSCCPPAPTSPPIAASVSTASLPLAEHYL